MKTYSQSLQNSKNLFDILSAALESEHKKFSDITTILFEGYDKKVNYFRHEVPIGTFIKAAKEVPVSVEPYEENPASSWDTEYVWFCEQSVYHFYNRNYFQRLLFVADSWTLIPVVDDGFGDYSEISADYSARLKTAGSWHLPAGWHIVRIIGVNQCSFAAKAFGERPLLARLPGRS